ncbi:LLM class flavin-dependent oxidoreductase [Streptomyces sp. MSC1_001]|uniref:LLM class flavin-dependent oxidoreductase n=1 Tax=Streptomyces sp. MSC1_001 TaxID=2909263 RepID=UPI0020303A1B|nr:LLM class flavin-dependent oxidoreductase [Streptomyces sp. MSC1_001]
MYVYSVTPESVSRHEVSEEPYSARVSEVAGGCEAAGWSGMLVPHNLHEVDPWVVATYVGSVTEQLVPLIAVQPASMPPHTAAAMASAYATLYGRPLHFNLVAGARDDELRRTGDSLSHDERYARMRVFGRILRALLRGEVVDEESPFYSYHRFRLEPCPAVLTECKVFVAGSSPASVGVARDIADVVVTHPAPYAEWERTFLRPLLADGYHGEFGIRIGIIARSRREDAWATARERFPETWRGRQETLLKTLSQNEWSRRLASHAMEEEGEAHGDPYWLGAFRSGRASAPFLVGTHEEVGARLAEYLRAGVGHVLLNGSLEDDYEDINQALAVARSAHRVTEVHPC